MIHTHDPYPFRGHDPYLWSIPMIHTSVIANPGHVLVLFLSCTYGTGGVTLIQTKQKRAAREQRNKYKPRTETSTNQEQKQEFLLYMSVFFLCLYLYLDNILYLYSYPRKPLWQGPDQNACWQLLVPYVWITRGTIHTRFLSHTHMGIISIIFNHI